jgi:hypothetical protein
MKYSRDFLRLSLTRRSLGRFATAMMLAYELDPCHELMIHRDEGTHHKTLSAASGVAYEEARHFSHS